jgi:hypothetical protein
MRALALVGALGACASSAAPEPVELGEFPDAARAAVCDWAVRCLHMPDQETCAHFLDPKHYDVRRAADAVAAGRLVYAPEAAGQCLADTAAAYCLTPPFSSPECAAMFSGLVATGEACTSDFECADRARCRIAACDSQCCLGTCDPPPTGEPPDDTRAAIGEACTTHADCVDEAYCETDRVCTRMPDAEGQRCLFGCARGDLYCDVDSLTCKRFGAPGEVCAHEGRSAPPCRLRPRPGEVCGDGAGACVAAAYCDDEGVCQARGGPGDACARSDQCDVVCDTAAGLCEEYRTCDPD